MNTSPDPWFEDVKLQPATGERFSQLAKELELASGKKLEDYPYDPKANAVLLHGLDKLRAIPSPVREQLWELHWVCEARERTGDASRDRRRDDAARASRELQDLDRLAKACLSGSRGRAAREAADHFLRDGQRFRNDLQSLRAFAEEYNRMKRGGDEQP